MSQWKDDEKFSTFWGEMSGIFYTFVIPLPEYGKMGLLYAANAMQRLS